MQFLLALVFCGLSGFLFWFVGKIITKSLKINEENKLFLTLLNISLGISAYLITINLISTILRNFYLGLIITFLLITIIIGWRFKEFKESCINLKNFFTNNSYNFIKANTDRYFWILIIVINLIYGLTAFSTTKLERFGIENSNIFNTNQLLAGNYPPRYLSLPSLAQKYHYGADILAATLSKVSSLHPEISLDLLTIIFLNLGFLTFYSLTIKFLGSKKINKYLVPFAAFLAWGPVTQLFEKSTVVVLNQKFLEKINLLTQSKLIDSASESGLVLHWFFAPPQGISIFFFLIALYLSFRFFTQDKGLLFTLVTGIFLSSLVIIDFTKFILIISGIILYLIIYSTRESMEFQTTMLKNVGILLLVGIVFGFINGNWLTLSNKFIPILQFYTFGKANIDNRLGPITSNTILLVVYIFGFYLAYKEKQTWVSFLIPFFVASILIPYIITMPDIHGGKIFMSGNLIGAFAFPLTVNFVQKQFNLTDLKLVAFYFFVFLTFSSNALMFFALGDTTKPVFKYENNSVKFTGFQTLTVSDSQEEFTFAKYLKSRNLQDKAILAEPTYAQLFSSTIGLFTILPVQNISNSPIKKEILDEYHFDYQNSFTLDPKSWQGQKIQWLYLTPNAFRYLMPPQARERLLIAQLNKGVKLGLSNKKSEDLLNLKELLEIDPRTLSTQKSVNFSQLLSNFIKSLNNSENVSNYLRQVALCPYFGFYNLMSKDFDGDKIADIAFFDSPNQKWYIVSGKNEKETEVDLSSIFSNYTGSDLFIPVPSDYDGDSKTDVALFNRTNALWYVLKSSTSELVADTKWGADLGEIPLPGDPDGDLKTDLSVYGSLRKNWPTLLSSTNSYFDKSFDASPIDIPAYADIDGDKKSDYVLYRPTTQRFYVYLSSCLNQGSAPSGGGCGWANKSKPIQIALGDKDSRVVIEDYDGDGKQDLATWSPESGKWEIAFSKDFANLNNNSLDTTLDEPIKVNIKTFNLGKPGDIPMPGDYNGDGKAEIAMYNTDSSNLEIIINDVTRKNMNLSKYKGLTPASFLGV